MTLKERINEDIKTAMKAKAEGTLRALRAIKSQILLVETTAGHSGTLTEAEEVQLLTKQAKQRKESIEQFEKNNRQDLANIEIEELAVIEAYLPKLLSAEELEVKVKEILTAQEITSVKEVGKAMKAVMAELNGKADSKMISEAVKKILV